MSNVSPFNDSFQVTHSRKTILHLRKFLRYLQKPLFGTLIISLFDLLLVWLVTGSLVRNSLVLLLFLEGGVGLLAGAGIALSSTPSVSKYGEMMFGTAVWSRDMEKNAEHIAGKWIIASSLIVLVGFAVSSF